MKKYPKLVIVVVIVIAVSLFVYYMLSGKKGGAMVYIPAGEFIMGSDTDELNEKPAHKIYLDAYYIDKYEVTNEQFTEFLNTYGKSTDDHGAPFVYASDWGVQFVDGKWKPVKGYEKHPAVYVTWVGADHYARFYNKRLPTEAEWENACRAGTTTKYYFGDAVTQTSSLGETKSILSDYAWYTENSAPKVDVSDDDEDDDNNVVEKAPALIVKTTYPVGKKMPNKYGIYDMYGNVGEWCADWYDKDYYKNSPDKNPKGPNVGNSSVERIARGGYWDTPDGKCRSSFRVGVPLNIGNNSLGFRCVKDIAK